jgi:O-antigen ligase
MASASRKAFRDIGSVAGENRLLIWIGLASLGTIAAVLMGAPKMLIAMGFASVIAVAVILFVIASTLYGRIDFILMGWVLLFPLGYYYLSIPRERSVFTLDRAVLGACMVAIAFTARGARPLPAPMRTAAILWVLFLVAAFLSLQNMDNPLGASKEVIDAFALPAVLGYYVWRNFPVRRKLSELHILSCLMCVYVAAISVAELLRGEDLLPLPSAIMFSDHTGVVQRVNGPFATNNSLGLIGLISLFLLIFLRRAIGTGMPGWQRSLHLAGLTSALTMALSPMFRSIIMTLVIVGILEIYWSKSNKVRLMVAGVALAGVAGIAFLRVTAPDFFQYRVSDMSDLYARIAQYKQTWTLFESYPLRGVGLANYATVADNVPAAYYRGVESVGSAHNTLASILVDTGMVGFLGYFLAQVYFFRAFWRLRLQGTPQAKLASRFALYIFMSYWITGLMLTSGYYSDMNLWYLFAMAVIYKCANTEHEFVAIPARAWERGTAGNLESYSMALHEH